MSFTGMYMNAIYAMYDLCYMDQKAEILSRFWSLPEFDLTVDITATEARYAIWGLQGSTDADVYAGCWPFISQLTLGGVMQGHVSIRPSSQSRHLLAEEVQWNSTIAVSMQPGNGTASLDTVSDLGGELDVHQTYNGADLDPKYVFSTCLKIMSYSAQFGPHTPAKEIDIDGGLVLTSDYDDTGKPLLRYRHVFKLMRVMANTMVRENHFGEMDVELWKYGRRIAWGRLKADVEAAMISVSVRNTVIEIS